MFRYQLMKQAPKRPDTLLLRLPLARLFNDKHGEDDDDDDDKCGTRTLEGKKVDFSASKFTCYRIFVTFKATRFRLVILFLIQLQNNFKFQNLGINFIF